MPTKENIGADQRGLAIEKANRDPFIRPKLGCALISNGLVVMN